MQPRKARPARSLREECLTEALVIIRESGVDALSLREVARRLGVSHQAPYKHFPSRDHLFAELIGRVFAEFASYLDARPAAAHPLEDLGMLGEAYQRYAAEHPFEYGLMFDTPHPNPADHPEMLAQAHHAFSILTSVLRRLHQESPGAHDPEADAMFVWSVMHGLVGIYRGDAIRSLHMPAERLESVRQHVAAMVSAALLHSPTLPT